MYLRLCNIYIYIYILIIQWYSKIYSRHWIRSFRIRFPCLIDFYMLWWAFAPFGVWRVNYTICISHINHNIYHYGDLTTYLFYLSFVADYLSHCTLCVHLKSITNYYILSSIYYWHQKLYVTCKTVNGKLH